jgi:GTP-binding protein
VVKSFPDERLMFDFSAQDMELVIARGGSGGRGNTRFKSSVRQAPRRADPGEKGEKIKVVLELKLIAFAGLVGLPNAGKSTLISKVSAARPKVAEYPFTTLTPHLGVVYFDHDSLVLADIPGIIAGAHKGEGMGLDFLKHIERNEVLVYLIDLSAADGSSQSPLASFEILRGEIGAYKSSLLGKKSLVVGNKADLLAEDTRRGADELAAACRSEGVDYIEISALKETNLEGFKKRLFKYYHDT